LGARYRVRQFARAAGAWMAADEMTYLKEQLQAPQLELFHRMARMDRHHCLAVFHSLREAGESDPFLLQAALLHDVGKSTGPVHIWHRVIAVLINTIAPRLLETVEGQPGTWRYPFFVQRNHAALGAELARLAGSAPEVVWLIAHHEDAPAATEPTRKDSKWLAALQAADEAN
jgi:putative nucleotidyltransferase with HDIG domain